MNDRLTTEQWQIYQGQGYLRLGKILSANELEALSQRIDDIMLGKATIDYEQLMMQRESDGMEPQSAQTLGFKGSTLNYRKIQNLEFDSLYLKLMQKPLFRHICEEVYGENINIACFRAMFMNKPAYHGSALTYHQDRWTTLDRDPLATVWIALDPATIANGCVKIFPGTHQSLINPQHPSGFLTEEQSDQLMVTTTPVPLELEPGEAVLLHNWTVHGSDGNTTAQSRRAFSVCFIDADTISESGEKFSVIHGSGALQA